jgi:methionyl-tRNA synthetase
MPFYITTPIYYVNDRPHIGHCYTSLVADVIARFHRLARGETAANPEIFFLTGTDEHADKVVTSAAAHGVGPQEWADRNAEEFKSAFAFLGLSHTDFIRTSQPRHKDRVPAYIASLMRSGDIYRGSYTGWYDEGQEEYVTETVARENDFKSPINKKPLAKRTEACYFFKLGKYQQTLLDLVQNNPAFIQPDARRQEVLGRLRPPAVLNDVPVSRPVTSDPATQWGIRIPGDADNRVYVWIDALFNYVTVVDTPERRKYWPADVHLLGKDILWFHAVIWPALLLALAASDPKEFGWVKLPKTIFGHGWWISEGEKMSKSMGNFIDLEKLQHYAGKYSLDALRWYLATQGPLSGADADFSHAKFLEVYNAELANGIGNCTSRVGNMIDKYFAGQLPAPGPGTKAGDLDLAVVCTSASQRAQVHLDRVQLGELLGLSVDIVRAVDQYINITQPFKLAKTLEANPAAKAELATILYNCAEALRVASLYMAPAMPTKIGTLWNLWSCTPPPGFPLAQLAEFRGRNALAPGQRVTKGDPLFMRADA